jgi:hypothetical protein
VIPARYEESGFFSSGRATFRLRRKWGFIDKKGKTIIDPVFEEASPFYGNLARIKKGGFYGLISTEGVIKLTPEYDEIIRDGDFYILRKNGKMQILSSDLEVLTEMIWDDISRTGDSQVLKCSKGIRLALFHTGLRKIFWEESGHDDKQ